MAALPTTTFRNDGKKRRWKLEDSCLSCEKCSVPIADVIAVRYVFKRSDPKRFQMVYAKPERKNNVWRPCVVTFRHESASVVIEWVETIRHEINQLAERPRRILMFVNPVGGKRRGLKIYENYAKPLFELAGVDLRVVVTKKKNEIRDALEEDDKLDGVDAVVCVGGDGTAGEVFTGLILRECRLQGVDPHSPGVTIPKPRVKVGVVPGGSTDTTSYCLHGTTDVVTSLLHIVMGVSLGLDLISVHHDNQLLQMSSNVISYGFLGDISYYSEKLRWMGPTRYEYVGTRKMLGGIGYEGTVSILGNEIDENQTKCYQNCDRCSSGNHDDNSDQWIDISSNFFLLAGANMSCAGSRNPHGLAPYCHLGDGYLNVLIVHHTSLYQRLRTFQRFTQSTYTMTDLNHVQTYRGKELRFKAGKVRGRWNCDGEPILDTDICARVHRQLIDVYSRGVAKN